MNSDMQKFLSSLRLSVADDLKKELIGVAILAAFSLLFYRFVYLGNVRKIADSELIITGSQKEIAAIKDEIQGSHRLKKSVEDASLNLNRLEARLKNIGERLPSDKNVSSLIAEISGNDSGTGVHVLGIKPLPHEDKNGLTRLPFLVTVEGRFTGIGDYLERIENMRRIMIVDNFMMEPKGDNPQVLSAQVYLSAYIHAAVR